MLKNLAGLLMTAAFLTVFVGPVHAVEDQEFGDPTATEAEVDEGFWALGVHFGWSNYRKPLMAYNEGNNPGVELTDYTAPNFGGSVHWGINKRFVLRLTLDLSYHSHNIYPYVTGDEPNITVGFFSIGGMLGAKFYLKKPVERGAAVYLSLDVGGYFSAASNNYDGENKDVVAAQVDMISALSSPFVVQAALGAEFHATNTFAIGADILGVRFAYSTSDVGKVTPTASNIDYPVVSGEQSMLNLSLYSALTMTFNLTAEPTARPAAAAAAPAGYGYAAPSAATPGTGQQNSGWNQQGGGWRTGPSTNGASTTPAAPAAPAPSTAAPTANEPPPPPPSE